MSAKSIYRVVRGAIRMSRSTSSNFTLSKVDMIMQGDILPAGFDSACIQSWLADGRIELVGEEMSLEDAEDEQKAILARNPFAVDPSVLVSKSMEDLVIMVLEIDPDYDTDKLASEQDAVRLLTSGWDPKYAQTVSPVRDRSKPQALAMGKLVQSKDGAALKTSVSEMSAEAQAGLANARAKAQAPDGESQ